MEVEETDSMKSLLSIDSLLAGLRADSFDLTRRQFSKRLAGMSLAALTGTWLPGEAQEGEASRQVKALPRGKPSGIPFHAWFTDVALQAGLTQPIIYGEPDRKSVILETVGCGAAFLDYDNDGWLDIFLLSGTRLDGSVPNATNRLYKNNRDGTFQDVTVQAGLVRTGWASSVTVGDYNNDGYEDIFITYFGQNVLYRNNGDGTFSDVTLAAGLVHQGRSWWGAGCTFLDYDRDGRLDLFVSNYVDLDLNEQLAQHRACSFRGIPVQCGPRGLRPTTNFLFHNQGDGTFRDVSRESGISTVAPTYGMTTVAADFDGDGWVDVFVASDSTPSLLFINQHDGTFKEQGLARGVAFSDDGLEQAGMGVAVGDYDLDGNLDIFKTNFSDDTDDIYKNDGTGNFTDVAVSAGFGVETRFVSWGTGFADLDNDGWPDIFVATGTVYPEIARKLPEYPMKSPRLIFHNLGNGKFEELVDEAGPGIAAAHCSRGCAFGDFDNDGDIDILVVNLNEPPSLLRNDLRSKCNWIKVLLIGTKSNRSAIGSRVIARYDGKAQCQAVVGQSSFYSVSDRRLHFGIGESTSVDLEIHWASGILERVAAVPVGRLSVIKEGEGIVKSEEMTGLVRKSSS